VRWDDDLVVNWLAASETLYPGVAHQLKLGERRRQEGGVCFTNEPEAA
jgi:hypothetical protein